VGIREKGSLQHVVLQSVKILVSEVKPPTLLELWQEPLLQLLQTTKVSKPSVLYQVAAVMENFHKEQKALGQRSVQPFFASAEGPRQKTDAATKQSVGGAV